MASFPIAYSLKKKKKMAGGGDIKGVHKPTVRPGESSVGMDVREENEAKRTQSKEEGISSSGERMEFAKHKHKKVLHEMRSMKKPELMAEGGQIEDNYQPEGNPHTDGGNVCPTCNMPTPHEGNDVEASSPPMEMNQMGDDEGAGDSNGNDPFVMKIMMGREKGFSEGGKVSNDTPPKADSMPADYDDLALRDNLQEHETGENSGDELGDAQEAEDRADIVDKIMKSRAKKDKLPRPA